jgi:hypothetical protein
MRCSPVSAMIVELLLVKRHTRYVWTLESREHAQFLLYKSPGILGTTINHSPGCPTSPTSASEAYAINIMDSISDIEGKLHK